MTAPHRIPNGDRRQRRDPRFVPNLFLVGWVVLAAAAFLLFPAPGRSEVTDAVLNLYVSPEGNDGWSGRLPSPRADGSDGPLATFTAARDAARASSAPSRIVVRGGHYYFSNNPISFDGRDAGLRIVAASGEHPVLHAGVRVDGWRRDGGRWWASLELPQDWRVWGLFLDGKRQTPARYPNLPANATARDGWLFADAPLDGMELNHQFRFRSGDLPELSDATGLTVHIVGGLFPGTQWGSDTLPVQSIDMQTRIVNTGGTPYFFTGDASRYFLEGREEFLDAPGEWWYDHDGSRLYYMSSDRNPAALPITIAFIGTFFDISGANDITISGLEFRDGAVVGTGKYGTNARGYGAVRLTRSDRAKIIDNRFENVGVAIHVSESSDVVIADNEIEHVAGNAIYFGTEWGTFGRSDGGMVIGNHIRDVGEVYFESAGIAFQAATGLRIADNTIERAAQFGISGGSVWGSQDACYHVTIEHNTVRDANLLTADGGAIKLMGAQSTPLSSTIRYNVVTGTDELMSRPDGSFWPSRHEDTREWPSPISWAIYLDGRASGVSVLGNSLDRNVTGIGINGGWSNVVRDNVIRGGAGYAFRVDDATGRDWRPDWAQPNVIENNSVQIGGSDDRVSLVNAPGHGNGYVLFSGNSVTAAPTE